MRYTGIVKRRFLPLVLVLFTLFLFSSLALAANDGPALFFEPTKNSTKDQLEPINVKIHVNSSGKPITSAQALVRFDPNQFELKSFDKVAQSPLEIVLFNNDRLSEGFLTIGALINLGQEQKVVKNSDGALATLSFQPKSAEAATYAKFECKSPTATSGGLCSDKDNKESCNDKSAILANLNNDGNPDHIQNIINCTIQLDKEQQGFYWVGPGTTPPFGRATPFPEETPAATLTPSRPRAGTPTPTPYPWDRFLTPRPGEATPTPKPVCDLCGKCGDAIPKNYEQCKNCNAQPKHAWTQAGCVSTETGGFMQTVINFVLPIAAGLAFLAILWGGFMIVTSQGDMLRVASGRNIIIGAIVALLLVLFSTFLLRLVGFDILGLPGFGGGK